MRLAVSVAWRLRCSWHAVPLLVRAARHTLAAEGFRTAELSIAVVGATAMRRLNARYTGRDELTDVLAFDLGTDRRRGHLDGEIIVCAAVARRVAGTLPAARGELALYVVHGVLHLSGYDDHTPRGFACMHAREDMLLGEIGLGRAFTPREK